MMGGYKFDGISFSFKVEEHTSDGWNWHVSFEINEPYGYIGHLKYESSDYYGNTLEEVNAAMRDDLDKQLDRVKQAFQKAVGQMYWTEGPGAWVPM